MHWVQQLSTFCTHAGLFYGGMLVWSGTFVSGLLRALLATNSTTWIPMDVLEWYGHVGLAHASYYFITFTAPRHAVPNGDKLGVSLVVRDRSRLVGIFGLPRQVHATGTDDTGTLGFFGGTNSSSEE